MRTTLTLDDDVASRLQQLRDVSTRSYKDLVNDLLRRGLDADAHRPGGTSGDYTRPQDLGRLLLADIDDVTEALAVAEGERTG